MRGLLALFFCSEFSYCSISDKKNLNPETLFTNPVTVYIITDTIK